MTPAALLSLLDSTSMAAVIDIRPDEEREENGVLGLRLSARSKAAPLPLDQAQTVLSFAEAGSLAVSAMNVSKQQLLLDTAAVLILGLKVVPVPGQTTVSRVDGLSMSIAFFALRSSRPLPVTAGNERWSLVVPML